MAKAPPISLENSLNFQIYKLSLLLSRNLKKALEEYQLTPERWQILASLWAGDKPLKQSEIGAITLKDKPSVSRLVEAMLEEGWLLRQEDADDRRAYRVKLSAKAIRLQPEIVNALVSHFEVPMRDLKESERSTFLALAKRYVAALESM